MPRTYVWRLCILALMVGLLAILAPSVGASPPVLVGPWTGSYFNGVLDSSTCFNPPATSTRIDPAVSYYWREGTSPWPGVIGTENYTVCWQGTFNFPTTGNYTFYTFHDDGIRVWVPDLSQPIAVDAWYDTGPAATQGTSYVPAGWHKVVVAYYNHTNAGVACADWAPEGAPNPLSCPYFPPSVPPAPVPVPVPVVIAPRISQAVINGIVNQIIDRYLPPRVPVAPAPGCFWYRVQFGDYLNSIAWRFGTTAWRIQQDNAIPNPNLIYVGQLLRICH